MSSDKYIQLTAATELFDFDKGSEWCRDINPADTALVESLISAATEYMEGATNRLLMERTVSGFFSCYQSSPYEVHSFVEIRRSPLVSIESVEVNGDLLSATDYSVKSEDLFARVLFKNEIQLDEDEPYPIKINFTAGYENFNLGGVPSSLVAAVKQLLLFWYENRGDVSPDKKQRIPFVVVPIIKQFRIVNTF